ncbi:MAG: DUF2177 family protein [Pseudomonadota bacterium]
MTIVALYVSALIAFLVLDILWLQNVTYPIFEREVGEMLADPPRLGVAVGFYLFYVAGVVYFAALPALRDGGLGAAALNGALLGLLAYGTYEMTNMATLKDWTWTLVVIDVPWGVVLTSATAVASVWVTRALGLGPG